MLLNEFLVVTGYITRWDAVFISISTVDIAAAAAIVAVSSIFIIVFLYEDVNASVGDYFQSLDDADIPPFQYSLPREV